MTKIIKTNDGYMIELPSGDYLCDPRGDNLFDDYVYADRVLQNYGHEALWLQAKEAFYAWEHQHYGDGESDYSDDDRNIWVEGYVQALKEAV